MDRITTALLEEFCKENDLKHLKEDERFEHFAAYLAVYRHHSETFDTTDVVVSDTGIDGIAILANGALVTDVDTVEELVKRNNQSAYASAAHARGESTVMKKSCSRLPGRHRPTR
jgi:hypothetical protein